MNKNKIKIKMSQLVLYEVTSHNDVEIRDEHTIQEVATYTGKEADILINYFYSRDDSTKNNCNEYNHYVTVNADTIIRIIDYIDDINSTSGVVEKNMKILLCFPVIKSLDFVRSDEYFKYLENIHSSLKSVVPNKNIDNRERLFLYNIW